MHESDKAVLKADIIAERGYWAPFHDSLLTHAPGFLRAYLDFQASPARAVALPQKLCELIYIAADSAVTHMYERGARRHMEFALKAGATEREILQTILLTTVVAAAGPLDLGLQILAEQVPGTPPPANIATAYGAAAWSAGPLSEKEKQLICLAICASPTTLYEAGMRRHIKAALAVGGTADEINATLQLTAAISIHSCTLAVPAWQQVTSGEGAGT